jgi:hypothetical protein
VDLAFDLALVREVRNLVKSVVLTDFICCSFVDVVDTGVHKWTKNSVSRVRVRRLMNSLSFELTQFESVFYGSSKKMHIQDENGNIVSRRFCCCVCGLLKDTLRRKKSILSSLALRGERLLDTLHHRFKGSLNILNIFWSGSTATPNKSRSQLVPPRCHLLDLGHLVSFVVPCFT